MQDHSNEASFLQESPKRLRRTTKDLTSSDENVRAWYYTSAQGRSQAERSNAIARLPGGEDPGPPSALKYQATKGQPHETDRCRLGNRCKRDFRGPSIGVTVVTKNLKTNKLNFDWRERKQLRGYFGERTYGAAVRCLVAWQRNGSATEVAIGIPEQVKVPDAQAEGTAVVPKCKLRKRVLASQIEVQMTVRRTNRHNTMRWKLESS